MSAAAPGRDAAPALAASSSWGGARMKALLRQSEVGLVALLVLASTIAAVGVSGFATHENVMEILNNSSTVIVVAVGEAMVIVARQIDLSVGAILGMCAYLVGSAVGHLGALSPVLGVLMALGLGGALGLFNGLLIERLKMPAIIATLATLSIYGGLQVVATHGSQLYSSQLPHWLANLQDTTWIGIGAFIWIALAVTIVGTVGLCLTRWGRDLYAMGSNPEAAQYLGIPTGRRTYEAFAACGALAGLGGLLYAAQYGNVDATAGSGFELTVIAAAVIGGVNLFGGTGTPAGAALGALLLIEIENILALLKISIFAQQTLEGFAIVLAVALYAALSRRLRRRKVTDLAVDTDQGPGRAQAQVARQPGQESA